MRISYSIARLNYGGAEKMLYDLIEGMLDRGHFVQLMYYIRGGELEDKFASLQIKGLDICFIERKHKLDISIIFDYAKILKSKSIDIVHGIMPPTNIYAVIAGIIANTKIKLMGLMASDWNYKSKLGTFIYFHLDHIIGNYFTTAYIANSESGKYFHILKGFEKKKLYVAQNGISIDNLLIDLNKQEKDTLLKKYEIGKNKRLVGMLSRIDPMKDHKSFLKAAALIKKSFINVVFMIVGGGNSKLLEELRKCTKDLDLDKDVIFVGKVDDVSIYYKVFDIYVMSSYTEGLSNTLLEAMACGKPVVSTDVGDAGKIINNGIDGFIVPPKNPNELAEKIIFFLQNPIIAAEMGKKAQEKAIANFTIDKMISRHLEVYNKLLPHD
jgi:glycosyltransferase involved in cell wall biosynthesis